MPLSEIANSRVNSHIVYSKDGLVSDFIVQALRNRHGLGVYDVLDVTSAKELDDVKDLVYLLPENFSKWVVLVDLDKVSIDSKLLAYYRSLRGLNNMVVVLKASNYKRYKQATSKLGTANQVIGSYLRKEDLSFILKEHGKKLPEQLVWFLSTNYGGEVRKIFKLVRELENGKTVHTKADIVAILGVSTSSVLEFTTKLLTLGTADTERKLSSRQSTLLKQGKLLTDKLGARVFYKQVFLTLYDFLSIKSYYLEGKVGKEFRSLPEQIEAVREERSKGVFGPKYRYRPASLWYYNRVLGDIEGNGISQMTIQAALLSLIPTADGWEKEEDMVIWLYRYFSRFAIKG